MAMERPVQLVLDASLLLEPSDPVGSGSTDEAPPALRRGVEALLRRLRYSNLGVAICHPEEMPTNASGFLEKTAAIYSFGYILLPAPTGNHSLNELMLEWSRTSSCFYATSIVDEDLFSELQNNGWRVIAVDNQCGTKGSGVVNVGKIQELLLTLTALIKKEIASSSVLTVGYAMKQSREEDFAKRGAFPLYPSKNGLIFVPLSFEIPLASQLQEVDIALHKMTDEIINIDPNCSIDFPKGISFSGGMSEIIRFVEEHPSFCIIDPFKNISPLLDRLQIQEILVKLQEFCIEGRPKLRAPQSLKSPEFWIQGIIISILGRLTLRKTGSSLIHQPSTPYPCMSPQSLHEINLGSLNGSWPYVIGLPVTVHCRILRCSSVVGTTRAVLAFILSIPVVKNFDAVDLQKRLAEANLLFPIIVKPQVACGVSDAHNMALVFQIGEFSNLSVPLPAILQEYIDHGSKIFKFYVIGDKVFHAIKNSMPNASSLKLSSGDEPLTFNSLKTLPVATKEQVLQTRVEDGKSLDINLVEEAAKLLKDSLGLTIFGFDVVVQEGSGDHVIVDLNYLPSFKEVPDSEAMPAFWDAIRQSYESKKGKMQT